MRHLPAYTLLLFLSACTTHKAPPVDPALVDTLAASVREHRTIPEKYILDLFEKHDIVFLGERHYIRHDPQLVQRLIPLLHAKGVNILCTEFARRVDQHFVDSLLSAQEYDEALARLITFNQFVHWGFREYLDIFRSAWQLNRNLGRRAPPFRILALNNSPNWVFVRTPEDRDNPDVMRRVWHGEDEKDWAEVILDSVVARGSRALVYTGAHHAFTEYRQPVVDGGRFVRFGDVRVGNHVFAAIGKRAVTILLHGPWFSAEGYDAPAVMAADGTIDALLKQLAPEERRFGIDTRSTPFGRLTGISGVYKHGYEKFTLATLCDGIICQGRLEDYEGVMPVDDFVNGGNLADARAQSPDPRFRTASVEEFFEAAVEAADIQKKMPKVP